MKQLLLFISIFFLLSSCSATRNQTRKQALREQEKTVKFKGNWGSSYLSPNYQKIADTTYVIGLIVRTRVEPTSEIVAEKLNELDKAALELENSLVRNSFRVYDRAVYHDLETANINLAYPFDSNPFWCYHQKEQTHKYAA